MATKISVFIRKYTNYDTYRLRP